MCQHRPSKIVSGGQTGVDRAALDVAMYLGIPHGGWCPAGRRSESGAIPAVYQLSETEKRDYSVRTEKNVIDSDGTLILFYKRLSGGTELTRRLASKHKRPCLQIDLAERVPDEFAPKSEIDDQRCEALLKWTGQLNIQVLNVAGPRASSQTGIGQMAEAFLVQTWTLQTGESGESSES
ncbi:MAG: hypothetical protein ACI87E_001600 [Mariniblastus sp.]|jgi:hypothetical protein